jgi:hypothetical protein
MDAAPMPPDSSLLQLSLAPARRASRRRQDRLFRRGSIFGIDFNRKSETKPNCSGLVGYVHLPFRASR